MPDTDPGTWPHDADRWVLNPIYVCWDCTDLILPGLDGYELLSVTGPPVTLDVRAGTGPWVSVTLPHTLQPGFELRVNRSGGDSAVTHLRALAPVLLKPTSAAFTVTTDSGGFETLTEGEITTDSSGYQTITNATATPNPDGFETVERSN